MYSSNSSSNAALAAAREGFHGARGTAGPMKTAEVTRSGCSAARRSDHRAPAERDTSAAAAVSVSSITASASAANSSSAYALGSRGRSERPLPRPSITSTRQWRGEGGVRNQQRRKSEDVQIGGRESTRVDPSVD